MDLLGATEAESKGRESASRVHRNTNGNTEHRNPNAVKGRSVTADAVAPLWLRCGLM